MNVSFEGIGKMIGTFAGSQCAAGEVCRIDGNGKVTGCADGDMICGVVEYVRGGCVAVQLEGFASVKYTGGMIAGYVNICANGNGGVKAGQGREHLVVSVNSTNKTAIIKL